MRVDGLIVAFDEELIGNVCELQRIGTGIDGVGGTSDGVGKVDIGVQDIESDRIEAAFWNDVADIRSAAIRLAENKLSGVNDTAGCPASGSR